MGFDHPGLIAGTVAVIDTEIDNYVATVFETVAAPLRTLLNSMAIVGLLFIAVNNLMQFRPVNYSQYLVWGFRFILIYTFATMWVNFQGIYDLVQSVPGDYSTLLFQAAVKPMQTLRTDILDPANCTNTYSSMDEFGHAIIWIACDFFRDTSISNLGMTFQNIFLGVLVFIIGGIFLGVAAIVVVYAKIGFAVAMKLAPLAIVMLMMDQTKQHFENWMRFAIGFVIIPLLTSALMALLLHVAADTLATSGASSLDKEKFFGFVFMMVAALVLLAHIPTMAGTLAASSVAVVGSSLASSQRMMNGVNRLNRAAKSPMGAAKRAYSAGQRLRDAAGIASAARKDGVSRPRAAWAAISGMRQSAMARQSRRDDRMTGRMPGENERRRGNPPPPAAASPDGGTQPKDV